MINMRIRIIQSVKRSVNILAQLVGIKWNILVDARVKFLLCFGGVRKRQKTFVIGLNKTGTSSLGEAMKSIGYRHLSYSPFVIKTFKNGDIATIKAIASCFDSFDDKPWNDPVIWPMLHAEHPDALWVYTYRDVAKWQSSYLKYSAQNNAMNEVSFIESLDAKQFHAKHLDAARNFERINEPNLISLDCDKLSSEGSTILSKAIGFDVQIGHHNRTTS